MKKVFALVLVLAMMLTAFAGCGGGEQEPGTTPEVSADPEIPAASKGPEKPKSVLETYPKKDMNGYEFMIKTYEDRFFTPKEVTGPISESILDRNRKLEEYFNIRIVKENGDYSQHWNEAQPVILGGDKWADLCVPTMWMMSFFFTGDALLDLRTVSTMHLDRDYYNQSMIEAGTVFDKSYIFSSEACSVDEFVSGVAFNKNILAEKDLENPYDLVRNNQWTIKKYREMARAAKEDLNGDGVMDKEDRWGHTGPLGDYEQGLFSGGDFPMIGRDTDGKYKILLDKPEIRDFAMEIKGMRTTDGTFFVKDAQAEFQQIYDVFKQGKILFVGHRIQEFFNYLRDMEQDWGIVPEPKMNEKQEHFSGWVDHNAPVMGIPKTTLQYEDAGLIIDAMSALSAEMVKPARYEEWSGIYFRDPENDLEMMEIIAESAYYDPTYILRQSIPAFSGAMDILHESVSETGDFASAYDRRVGMIQDTIDQFYRQGDYAE